jgi:hypothetical protein
LQLRYRGRITRISESESRLRFQLTILRIADDHPGLQALFLQIFYSSRSERMLVEQLDYNLLFRWFVGMSMDERHVGTDSGHQESRAAAEARHRGKLLRASVEAGRAAPVGRTLHRRWRADRGVASQKSFRRKDGSDDGDGTNFHGTPRRDDTHQSTTTDPDAKLYRKSSNAESKLS